MRILYVHSLMFNNLTWTRVAERLAKEEMGRPVTQLLRIHNQTAREWLEDERGLNAASLVYGLAQPEMAGAIEPTVFAARRPKGEALCCEPVPLAEPSARNRMER